MNNIINLFTQWMESAQETLCYLLICHVSDRWLLCPEVATWKRFFLRTVSNFSTPKKFWNLSQVKVRWICFILKYCSSNIFFQWNISSGNSSRLLIVWNLLFWPPPLVYSALIIYVDLKTFFCIARKFQMI